MPTPNPQAVEAAAIELFDLASSDIEVATAEAARAVQAAEPHIRSQLLDELRKAAEELESDPAADCGTYIHDVEAAILRLLRNRP